jgi:regulator of cell morphogenesis and NO signaling
MTTTTLESTVGQIAAETPASVRVFEKYRIDFCCGGKTGFADACRERGLEPEAVLGEIGRAAAVPAEDATDWRRAPLPALIDHIIETHHVYLKTQLPRIEGLIEKVMHAHGAAVPPIADVFGAMKAELDAHLMKEEMILFPLIRSGASGAAHCGGIQNPIRVMLAEHDSAGDALGQLRALTGGYTAPPEACNTWRALYFELAEVERDLHRHIHLENNVLFPRAMGQA